MCPSQRINRYEKSPGLGSAARRADHAGNESSGGNTPRATAMSNGSTERKSARHVARFGAGERWFPYGISEVVAHTDDRFVSVAVTCSSEGRGRVLMHEFGCEEPDTCLRELRFWLRSIAALSPPVDPRATEWADAIARRILAALHDEVR
jgi:hypothetical protein